MSGLELVQALFRGWAPDALIDTIAGLSLLTTFDDIARGVISLRDLVMFGSLIAIALLVNVTLVELNKGS
jgi:ABC-2 type transport system permease protein